jgi:hypothetical protein
MHRVTRRWCVFSLDENDYEYKPLRLTHEAYCSITDAIHYAMLLQWLRPDLTVIVESVISGERLSVRRWVDREMKDERPR